MVKSTVVLRKKSKSVYPDVLDHMCLHASEASEYDLIHL